MFLFAVALWAWTPEAVFAAGNPDRPSNVQKGPSKERVKNTPQHSEKHVQQEKKQNQTNVANLPKNRQGRAKKRMPAYHKPPSKKGKKETSLSPAESHKRVRGKAQQQANQRAKQHASNSSAFNRYKSGEKNYNKQRNFEEKKKAGNRAIHKKKKGIAQTVGHTGQLEGPANLAERPDDQITFSKQDSLLPLHFKVVKKKAVKDLPENGRSPEKKPKHPKIPHPVAVLSFYHSGVVSIDHSRTKKGKDRGLPGTVFALFSTIHEKQSITERTWIPRKNRYSNQWIHAPPTPPPQHTFSFYQK